MTIPYTVLNPTAIKRRETIARELISLADLDFIISSKINGVCFADGRDLQSYKHTVINNIYKTFVAYMIKLCVRDIKICSNVSNSKLCKTKLNAYNFANYIR